MDKVILTRENAYLYRNTLFFWNLEKYFKGEPKFIGFQDMSKSPNEYVFLKDVDETNVYLLTLTNFLKKKYQLVALPKLALDELEPLKEHQLMEYLDKLEFQLKQDKPDDLLDKLGRIHSVKIIASAN